MKKLRYPIRAVSKLTGIPVETLRAWERRYGVVEPARDTRGRLYSEADVERLRLLRRAVDAGHAIGRVAPLSTGELRALSTDRLEAPLHPSGVALAALEEAISRFDPAALRRELSRLAAVVPIRALCREVLLPLLNRIGDAWAAGALDIAREHLVSAEIRSLLGALARLHDGRDGAGAIVFATPAGELHELGTLAAAVIAADAGLGGLFLGANLPAAEVVSAAARVRAPVVVLGWTGGRPDRGPDPQATIAEIARDLSRHVELWVGGHGAREAERASAGRATPIESFDAFERALARLSARR
ncbi:MAG TPA: MerR family transcriptional regulator [Anaeromyxobacteraceae bacterium]|nr:MerR family transcriptional regulator [Anaeromyxobacteraceae bacterium]